MVAGVRIERLAMARSLSGVSDAGRTESVGGRRNQRKKAGEHHNRKKAETNRNDV